MNRKYNLKLDLQFRCNNSIMKFNQFDNNTSDFFIKISNGGKSFDVEKAIVVLAVIKPSGKVASQFIEVKNGLVYVDLKPNMKDEIGTYTAQAMLILEDERVVTDSISYEVEEDKIFSLLNDTVEDTEDFTLLTDMLNRLSTIEISEEQRVINEAERILSEENRKIEESKRVEAELIRQHEEADRTKYDAIRESNENIRKQNESIRLANETNRVNEEAKRVEEEANRVEAEQLRKDNYNFMTEDEERRRLEANAHKEAEVLRVQAETNRVNEEAKRRTTEQARVSAENTRVSNENARETNEVARQNNENQRIEAETQRKNRYNSFISDAEANANNFENYTNAAKAKEEERKANELNRKSQEDRRVSNEVERISNENTRKANEKAREKNETSRQNTFANKVNEVDKKISELNTTKDNFVSSVNTKVDTKISELDTAKSDMTNTVTNKIDEVENRFNALTSKQQQDAEVVDARDGETSLKARLDRDIEKAKQVYVNVEGSHISTDSTIGYAKNVEILGNTIQSASNLADIRSVGDKVEGQELYEIPVVSCGKNLLSCGLEIGSIASNGTLESNTGRIRTKEYIQIKNTSNYVLSRHNCATYWVFYDINYTFISRVYRSAYNITNDLIPNNAYFLKLVFVDITDVSIKIQIEEGTVTTPYEPYVEDKLTILSPTPLEKVGDVSDRLIEKDGVWGVEKNISTFNDFLNCTLSVWGGQNTDTGIAFYITSDLHNQNVNAIISNKFLHGDPASNKNNFVGNSYRTYILRGRVPKDGLSSENATGIKEYLHSIGAYVKYVVAQPQFIPLPHSQQVKLRTFANKTNISFLTEIEGTIKAQVPKSLGATVNTHTEQINNLNKELDRVKKLEESTVSTVTTESDFTTVEATSNGYFEDVKLEGKTLVNLATQPTNNGSINHQYATISTVTNIKPSTVYTYIIRNNGSETLKLYLNTNGGFDWFDLDVEANSTVIGKAKTLPTIDGDIWLSLSKAETIEQNLQVVLLEGDHTQNPPSFFEGLKSVGQSATTSDDVVDEIVVESVKGDENLFDVEATYNTQEMVSTYKWYVFSGKPNTNYTISSSLDKSARVNMFLKITDYNYTQTLAWLCHTNIANVSDYKTFTTDSQGRVGIAFSNVSDVSMFTTLSSFSIYEGNAIKPYVPYQSDKKRLLYYNTETQTWEKPILRQWDSIEKHTNGKYYYHVRSIEEDYVEGDESVSNYITDMTTTVKPLSQEKVYECTNIDLITYANETNFIIESGVLSPKTTLKVHSNISNVVRLLQKKVSLLESNMTKYMITQNRLMLASRYNADTVSFKVDVASFSDTFEYDNDLYELILNNILVGKDNYNREYIENLIRFYWMDFIISDEMYSTLFEIIKEQHNPKIEEEEETPLI